MKRHLFLLGTLFVFFLLPGLAQAQLSSGFSVTCDNGASFDNGVEIVITQMRSGFTYTATAIGIDDFDPVLAVLYTGESSVLCSDDEPGAARYAADLPTTGRVPSSELSAQIDFSQNSRNTFEDVSLVVGGYGNQTGEFILILEGMGVTSGDGAGDIFSVNLTPGMVASGVPLTVYMITRGQSTVDPLFYVIADADLNVLTDSDGLEIYCDDADNPDYCYTPMDIGDSSITITSGELTTWEKDAVLSLDISNFPLDEDPLYNFVDYAMTSYNHETQGQYLLAFHIGITEDIASSTSTGSGFSGGSESGG